MQFLNTKDTHFYADLPSYIGRLRFVALTYLILLPILELTLTTWNNFYASDWLITGVFSAGLVGFLWLTYVVEYKKLLAYLATFLGVIGFSILIYRIVTNDFNVLLTTQLLFGLAVFTFIFDKRNFTLLFVIPISLMFGYSLAFADFSKVPDLAYCLGIALFIFFFSINYAFKEFRLKLLKFSEKVLNSYDKYVIVTTAKGRVVYVNNYTSEQFGFHPKAYRKNDWWEMRGLPEEEIKAIKAWIAEKVASNAPVPAYEQNITLPDGTEVVVEWNNQVIDGKYYFGIGSDISARKRIRQEEEKLSKITKALGAGVAIAGKGGTITWCNDSFCAIFGYEKEELVGIRPSEFFEVPDFFKDRYAQLIQNGIEVGRGYEIPHFNKQGDLIWILLNSSPYLDDKGVEIGTIEVVTDITRQKRNEKHFQQISLIAQRTQTPVLICDSDFSVNWLNSAFLQEFDCAFEDVIGSNFIKKYTGNWTDRKRIVQLKIALGGDRSYQDDICLRRHDVPQWYKLTMDPVRDENDGSVQYMIIMQNIQTLKDAQGIIEQKNHDLVASISYAKRIQSALLPDSKLLKENMPDHFFMYRPKDIVSGDFYYVKRIESKLFIAVADCTGHGVPGAMITSIGAAAINNGIFDKGLSDPGEILEHTDTYLKGALSASDEEMTDGMDLGMLVIDFETEQMHFSGARRPLIMINAATHAEATIPGDKRSIGEFILDEKVAFTTYTFPIDETYQVYLFTDGITDQFGGQNHKKVRFKKMMELIMANHELPLDEQNERFKTFFKEWTNNYEVIQTDDMLLFAASISPTYVQTMKNKIKKTVTYES